MWVLPESKASLDHRVPRVPGATQAWRGPKERRVLVGTKAWWALLAPLGLRARKVREGHQAELGRKATWEAKEFEVPRE